jgi:hypothetical protein
MRKTRNRLEEAKGVVLDLLGPHTRAFAPLVYLSGPDGSGKTTVARELVAGLSAAGIRTKYIYSLKFLIKAFTKRLIRPIAPLFLKAAGKENRDERTRFHHHIDRDSGRRSWRVRRFIDLLVSNLDAHLGMVIVSLYRAAGRVVILETSPYDIFTKHHMAEFPRTERLLSPVFPRPTVGLLLVADAHRIVARKAELTVEEIEEYYRRLHVVFSRAGASGAYLEVRTDSDRQRSVDDAVSRILDVAIPPAAGRYAKCDGNGRPGRKAAESGIDSLAAPAG